MDIQKPRTDRISALHQDILENILTLMPIRDAIRTSILSRRWRFCWTSMPKIVFNESLDEVPSNKEQHSEHSEIYKLSRAIFHVLLQHTGSILEFGLNFGELDMRFELDQIMRYLSRSNKLKNLVLENSEESKYFFKLPSSFFLLQELEVLELDNCYFEPPLQFKGFSRLQRVYFGNVEITSKMLQRFLSGCPLLTDVTLDGDGYRQDTAGGNKFTFVQLLECVPLIRRLDIRRSPYMEYLSAGGMSHMLPNSLVHLKYLYLEVHIDVPDELSSALCLMRNSPNLEKIILTKFYESDSDAPEISINFPDLHDYAFNFDHLEDFTMENFSNFPLQCEIIKLIMAKSPMLKTARIELEEDVSVEDELKILRERIRMPFSRASPSAITIMSRPEPSS